MKNAPVVPRERESMESLQGGKWRKRRAVMPITALDSEREIFDF
jgi:hypothetical protein